MGCLATIGQNGPSNLKHIIINNGSHDSVGGQPTDAQNSNFSFCDIAKACGYKEVSKFFYLGISLFLVIIQSKILYLFKHVIFFLVSNINIIFLEMFFINSLVFNGIIFQAEILHHFINYFTEVVWHFIGTFISISKMTKLVLRKCKCKSESIESC